MSGATKKVSKAVGFQLTLPIDYILEYVLRKNTQLACVMYDHDLITVWDGGTLHSI